MFVCTVSGNFEISRALMTQGRVCMEIWHNRLKSNPDKPEALQITHKAGTKRRDPTAQL